MACTLAVDATSSLIGAADSRQPSSCKLCTTSSDLCPSSTCAVDVRPRLAHLRRPYRRAAARADLYSSKSINRLISSSTNIRTVGQRVGERAELTPRWEPRAPRPSARRVRRERARPIWATLTVVTRERPKKEQLLESTAYACVSQKATQKHSIRL